MGNFRNSDNELLRQRLDYRGNKTHIAILMTGWIKTYRKFVEWEWFDNAEMVQLFMYLLLSANHEPQKWHGITVERGQVIIGRAAICKKLKLSPQVYRTCIERLKSTNEITSESTNKFTVITICKYADYQQEICDGNQQNNQQNNQQVTNKQPTNNQQITTNKNDKNEIIKEDKKDIGGDSAHVPEVEKEVGETIPPHGTKARGAARFVPPTVAEVAAYCAERGNAVDAGQWYNYYTSNGWKVGKNPMKDWKAAVRTWENNGYRNSNRQQNGKPTLHKRKLGSDFD
jgi:hypothetical protein